MVIATTPSNIPIQADDIDNLFKYYGDIRCGKIAASLLHGTITVCGKDRNIFISGSSGNKSTFTAFMDMVMNTIIKWVEGLDDGSVPLKCKKYLINKFEIQPEFKYNVAIVARDLLE